MANNRFHIYLLLIIAFAAAFYSTIIGLSFYFFGELSLTPIIPTCCAGI